MSEEKYTSSGRSNIDSTNLKERTAQKSRDNVSRTTGSVEAQGEYSKATGTFLSEYKPEHHVKAYEAYKNAYHEMQKIEISPERASLDIVQIANERMATVYGENGILKAQIDKQGHIEIENEKTGEKGHLKLDLASNNIISNGEKTRDEKTIEDAFYRCLVETRGREALPRTADINVIMKNAIEMAEKNLGKKIDVEINGVKFNISMNPDKTFNLMAKETFYPNTECVIWSGQNITKEELMSIEAAQKIKETVGIGMVMKADKAIHEEIERDEQHKEGREDSVIASTTKSRVEDSKNQEGKTYTVRGNSETRMVGSLSEAYAGASSMEEYEKHTNALDGIPVTGEPMKNFDDPINGVGDGSLDTEDNPLGNPEKSPDDNPFNFYDQEDPERNLFGENGN